MAINRTDRLNSLLKEVISEVIFREVKNPHVNELLTVTHVEITKDLHYAKVYVSVIGSDQQKKDTIAALQSAAGFIAVNCSKKITIRYFPTLTFKLDESVDKQLRIEMLLHQISAEKNARPEDDISPEDKTVINDETTS